jgi:phosphatidate cytidylyltransferase
MARESGPQVSGRSRGQVGGRNLPLAIGVGVGLAVVFLGSLWWDPRAFLAVVAIVATVAYVEAGRILAGVGRRVLVPVLVPATVAMLVGALLGGTGGLMPGVVALLLGAVVWQLVARDRRDTVATLGLTAFFGLWVGLLASYAILLVDQPDGPLLVLAVIGSAVFCDVGAYAFGVAFGRHKLAPTISPAKSWEGLVGGLLVASVLAAVVLPLLGERFTPGSAAVLGFSVGLAAAVGDLVESLVKRDLGVKDLGDVLPGHGGILDRVDGILLGLPVGYYVIALLG